MTSKISWRREFREELVRRAWLRPLKIATASQHRSLLQAADAADPPDGDWSEEEIVSLHWRLLKRIEVLPDSRTPLEEKLDLLRWVFTDPARDTQPFSFVNCVKVVSLSPLSPAPYFIGVVDSEEVRDWIRQRIGVWLAISVEAYPVWVQQAIARRPDWIAAQLERNPQWLNEQLRRNRVEGDLFA